jgi:hypothetical protein
MFSIRRLSVISRGEQAGRGQRDGREEADVGHGRERHLPRGDDLVVRPHRLAERPARRRGTEQVPRQSEVPAAPGGPRAGHGRRDRRQELGKVVHQRERRPLATEAHDQPDDEADRGGSHGGRRHGELAPIDRARLFDVLPH